MMNMKEFYSKFPSVLKNFLTDGNIQFSENTKFLYEEFVAYRGVIRENNDDTPINNSDFLSYAELGKKPRGVDVNSLGYYSCSLFLNAELVEEALKLPKPNKRIIKGIVKYEDGPQETNLDTRHVHWWLFDKERSWKEFTFWERDNNG